MQHYSMIFALKKCIFLLDVMLQLNILYDIAVLLLFPIPYSMRRPIDHVHFLNLQCDIGEALEEGIFLKVKY
jgi:hypothetical protein